MNTKITIPKDIAPIVEEVSSFTIKTQDDMAIAAELLSRLNKRGDQVEAEKEKVMRPALDTVAALRKQWAPFEKPLEQAIALLRGKMSEFQRKQVAKDEKKQERIAENLTAGKISADKAMTQMETATTTKNKVETNSGSVSFKPEKRFEVVDISKLPYEYLHANEVSIRKAMKDGFELPGVRYWIEQVPINYR